MTSFCMPFLLCSAHVSRARVFAAHPEPSDVLSLAYKLQAMIAAMYQYVPDVLVSDSFLPGRYFDIFSQPVFIRHFVSYLFSPNIFSRVRFLPR